jgi:hypothetical protein
MAYFAFVSYARVNVGRKDPRDPLLEFLGAVKRRIEQRPDILGNGKGDQAMLQAASPDYTSAA